MGWFFASQLITRIKGPIHLRDEDARTVRLRHDTLCSNGGYEAWFAPCNTHNFVVYGQKHKVWVLVFLVRTSVTLRLKKTRKVFLKLISHDNFLLHHLSKSFSDEKYSRTSPPTSLNGFNIQDAAGSSVLRWSF